MIPYFIILASAIGYALIRAKHDSFITQGKWKTWAFIEGVFWCILLVTLVLLSFTMKWWFLIVLGPIFAFSFWLVFDCVVGWYFSGNILYLGDQGFDLKMRGMALYNKPIFGWKETGSVRLIFFKLFWLVLLTLSYSSLLN